MRITPFARPVVPDEYGSTAVVAATDLAGGSAVVPKSRRATRGPRRVQGDDRPRRQAGLRRRGGGPVEERRDGDQQLGPGIGQLVGQLAGGVERVRAGDDGVGAQHPVEHRGVVRRVRREQPDHVAGRDPALGQRRGDLVDHVGELVEGDRRPARPVHERRRPAAVPEPAGEQEVVQGDLGDLTSGYGLRTGMRHSSANDRTGHRGRNGPTLGRPAVGRHKIKTLGWPSRRGCSTHHGLSWLCLRTGRNPLLSPGSGNGVPSSFPDRPHRPRDAPDCAVPVAGCRRSDPSI